MAGGPLPESLRPMAMGELLDQTLKIYWRSWKALVAVGVIATLPGIISTGLTQSLAIPNFTPSAAAPPEWIMALNRGDFTPLVGGLASFGLLVLIGIFLYPLFQGALVIVASRAVAGGTISARDALRVASASYWALLGTSFLKGLFMLLLIPLLVLGGLVILSPITVPAGLIAFYVYFSFTDQAVVLEGTPGGTAPFGRSRGLVKGLFWRTFGISIAIYLLYMVLSMIISLVSALPSQLLHMFVFQNVWSGWISAVLSGITGAIIYPFLAVGITTLYYDLRIRKEGYDLEMMVKNQSDSPSTL